MLDLVIFGIYLEIIILLDLLFYKDFIYSFSYKLGLFNIREVCIYIGLEWIIMGNRGKSLGFMYRNRLDNEIECFKRF